MTERLTPSKALADYWARGWVSRLLTLPPPKARHIMLRRGNASMQIRRTPTRPAGVDGIV